MLDTNVLLWILMQEERRITKRAQKALSAPTARLVVSVVSIWEILLKRHAGKLLTTEDPDSIVQIIRSSDAWHILPLDVRHFRALSSLAAFTDHTDPFDRLLIAQAKSENLSIMTPDAKFARYGTPIVWN